jgi:hypothetical protein
MMEYKVTMPISAAGPVARRDVRKLVKIAENSGILVDATEIKRLFTSDFTIIVSGTKAQVMRFAHAFDERVIYTGKLEVTER